MPCSPLDDAGQVPLQVNAECQEIGNHNHAGGATLHQTRHGLGQIRLPISRNAVSTSG
jgi:hypothetical protein